MGILHGQPGGQLLAVPSSSSTGVSSASLITAPGNAANSKLHVYTPCRATYAAENAVQRLEKGKKEQDLLIDHLHGQIKGHQRQIALFTQQHAAQQRETRAAQETLAEAAAEMEGVAFEKKQLTAQWQSSLIAMQKRDEALKVGHLWVVRLVLQHGNLGRLTQRCPDQSGGEAPKPFPEGLQHLAHLTRAQAWGRICAPVLPLQQRQCPGAAPICKIVLCPFTYTTASPLLIIIPWHAGAGAGSGCTLRNEPIHKACSAPQ